MNTQKITGWGLGLYFGSFVIAALLGLPRLLTYLAASGVGAATIGYALYTHQWSVVRERLVRWQLVIGVFLGIVCISYFVNRDSYDVSLTLKVVGYSSMFFVASFVAAMTGYDSFRSCSHTYLACLLFAMVVTLAVNNTNSNNHRLLGPTYKDDIQGSGLHHNEVGLLAMTAVMLATVNGWPLVLVVTPLSLYTAYLSGSRGSMLGILIALAIFGISKEFLAGSQYRKTAEVPQRGIWMAGLLLVAVAAVGIFAGTFVVDDVLKLHSENRGLSSGFTGRLDVWQGMLDHWKQRPLLGQGYGIVRGEASRLGETADGGFLLLTAELGLAGLFLFLFLIHRTIKVSYSATARTGDSCSITMLVFVITFCFINLFESRFVGTGSIGLGMFIYFSSLCTIIPAQEASTLLSPFSRSANVDNAYSRLS